MPADVARHVVAPGVELVRHEARRIGFLVGQFGMLVDVMPDLVESRSGFGQVGDGAVTVFAHGAGRLLLRRVRNECGGSWRRKESVMHKPPTIPAEYCTDEKLDP